MKICLIAPIPPYRGGASKYSYSLAQELERRHDLLLLSYRRQYPQILFRKSQTDPAIDAEEIKREFRRLTFDIDSVSPLSWAQTVRTVAEFAPDLVVLPWFVVYWGPMYLYLLRAFKKRGIRVVIPCINVYEHEDNAVKRLLSRAVLGSVPSLIVHSEKEREEILEFHPGATVKKHLLPLFEYDEPQPGRGSGPLKLLFFGCVRPYKGLDTLLHALALLKDREIALTIAGEFWWDKEEYLKLIGELGIAGRVEIVDQYIPQDDLGGYFSRADLVVLPYKKTKTSGIIATAYAFGKPVLATDVGGFYEVVRDGETGRIVPADDPQAFADGIVWFMENREIDFGRNIARFAEEAMSWGSLVDQIEEFAREKREKNRF